MLKYHKIDEDGKMTQVSAENKLSKEQLLAEKPRLITDLGTFVVGNNGHKQRFGLYECPICKNEYRFSTGHVNSGHTTKCKSCATSIRNITHGKTHTKEYSIWVNMRQRCTNNLKPEYKYYGGKGVKVCDEWSDFDVFYKWLIDSGYNKNSGLTIDRKNTDGDYTPNNCRLATHSLQCVNQKLRITNTSGFKGISFYKPTSKWVSTISYMKKRNHLGYFDSAEDAAIARDKYILANNLPHELAVLKASGYYE